MMWSDSKEAAAIRARVLHPTDDKDEISKKSLPRPSKVDFQGKGFLLEVILVFGDEEQVSETKLSFDEVEFTELLYTDPLLYERFGREFCVCYDFALAKGGPESVVESVYSVMNNQKQFGGQKNETLVQRTKIDWTCPVAPLGIQDFIDEATSIYTVQHATPYAASNFGVSKVFKRLELDTGKIPPKV